MPPPRGSLLSRLLTQPLSPEQLERRAREAVAPAARWLVLLAPAAALAVLAYLTLDLWSLVPPKVTPRHRAEALCFALARPDPRTETRFEPPMHIEPSAALVRHRFSSDTPASHAMRSVMHLTDESIIREWRQSAGDFTVTAMWLRLPPESGARHWLVVGWMEGDDLAVCNFRFAGDQDALSPAEEEWGRRLLARILRPEYFRADAVPATALRIARGNTMPTFGPETPAR